MGSNCRCAKAPPQAIDVAREFFSSYVDPFFEAGDILSFRTGRNSYMTNSSGSVWLRLERALEEKGYRIIHESELP